MNEKVRETVSALMDDELRGASTQRALDSLLGSRELKERWEHYHVARAALSNDLGDHLSAGFASRVRAAIESEPVPMMRRGVPSTLLRPLAGLALAASVAAVAILGVRSLQPDPVLGPVTVAAVEVAEPALPAAAFAGSRVGVTQSGVFQVAEGRVMPLLRERIPPRWNDLEPRVEARLSGYLVNHTEYLGHSLWPYVRIVGYDEGN